MSGIDRATRNGGDSLKQVQRFFNGIKRRKGLTSAIKSRLFLPEYALIQERVSMLLENGLWGILGIFVILNFFLPGVLRYGLRWVFLPILGALSLMYYADMVLIFGHLGF